MDTAVSSVSACHLRLAFPYQPLNLEPGHNPEEGDSLKGTIWWKRYFRPTRKTIVAYAQPIDEIRSVTVQPSSCRLAKLYNIDKNLKEKVNADPLGRENCQ